MIDEQWRLILLVSALAAAGLLILAAAAELARAADRAEHAGGLAEAHAWQVSQVLDNVRRITAEAAERHARGELP
jgi:hypothetical protein